MPSPSCPRWLPLLLAAGCEPAVPDPTVCEGEPVVRDAVAIAEIDSWDDDDELEDATQIIGMYRIDSGGSVEVEWVFPEWPTEDAWARVDNSMRPQRLSSFVAESFDGRQCGIDPAGDGLCWSIAAEGSPDSFPGPMGQGSINVYYQCWLTVAGHLECTGDTGGLVPWAGSDEKFRSISASRWGLQENTGPSGACVVTWEGELLCAGTLEWDELPRTGVESVKVSTAGQVCIITDSGAGVCQGAGALDYHSAESGWEFEALDELLELDGVREWFVDSGQTCWIDTDSEFRCLDERLPPTPAGFRAIAAFVYHKGYCVADGTQVWCAVHSLPDVIEDEPVVSRCGGPEVLVH